MTDYQVNIGGTTRRCWEGGAKIIQWKKDSIFNNWCWHNWWLSCRRIQIDPFLSFCTKLKSKWIKELHIKPETLKLIEEKVGKSLEDMGTGGKFLHRSAMACAVRSRINKWDLIKLQSWAGEMAQWLRAPTALLKVLSSNPSNHMVAHNHP